MLKEIRPMMIAVVLVVSLVGIFGGQYLYKQFYLEAPFKERVLSIEGVAEVLVDNQGDVRKIELTLSQQARLPLVYAQVKELAQNRLKGETEIVLASDDSQLLMGVYREMHFAIFEGIARGEYTQMQSNLEKIANETNVDKMELEMDSERIYLKLIEDNEVFCKVIPRTQNKLAMLNIGTGGEIR